MADENCCWPLVSGDAAVQAHYERCRGNGCAHGLAEMLALRQFPGIAGTDAVFNEGRQWGGGQFDGLPHAMGAEYQRQAARAGVNPAGKYYCGPLARWPGDPRAWIDGRGDVARICAAEGWTAEGAVTVAPPRYADGYVPPAKYTVAPAIVAAEVADRIAAEPELARRRDELTHEVATLRAGEYGR